MGIHILGVVNLSICARTFPNKWKLGKILPLYKGKCNKYDPESYRLVCLLSSKSKVLEKVMIRQITEFMDNRA